MISDALLAHIRIQAESIMTASATVYRKAMVSDDAGGFLDTYSVVGTYACSYAPYGVTPLERERAFGIEAISLWRFQFPLGTVVLTTDRIETDSRQFEVVDAGGGSIRAAVRVVCQELAEGAPLIMPETDTAPEEVAEEVAPTTEEVAEEAAPEPEPVKCRHCGEAVEGAEADADFLCPHCERYQDSTICPTCHQVTRLSLMSPEAKEA